jgi:formate hydrogenlyase subunit 6/NADH:ubiquinone oxidoreductase subunit I
VLNLDTDRCTLCGACANACPTGALRFDEATSETALRFTAAACVACKRCVAVCPEEALAVSPGIDAARLVRGTLELAQAAVERCRSCGAELPPGPMRRRLRELVPRYADAPVDLCAGCAARTTARQSNTIA